MDTVLLQIVQVFDILRFSDTSNGHNISTTTSQEAIENALESSRGDLSNAYLLASQIAVVETLFALEAFLSGLRCKNKVRFCRSYFIFAHFRLALKDAVEHDLKRRPEFELDSSVYNKFI